ncbi:MAG TPA: hypothetical protein VFY84_12250 [Jiangellales bacterium]|nr:hypothetical protein [Jiangellales bacterium]
METLSDLAEVAAGATASNDELGVLRTPSVVLHSTLAVLLLLVATVLGVYTPQGMTRYGLRKQHERRSMSQP